MKTAVEKPGHSGWGSGEKGAPEDGEEKEGTRRGSDAPTSALQKPGDQPGSETQPKPRAVWDTHHLCFCAQSSVISTSGRSRSCRRPESGAQGSSGSCCYGDDFRQGKWVTQETGLLSYKSKGQIPQGSAREGPGSAAFPDLISIPVGFYLGLCSPT